MEMAGSIVKLTCSKEISVTTIFGSKKEIVAVQPIDLILVGACLHHYILIQMLTQLAIDPKYIVSKNTSFFKLLCR